MPLKGLPLSTCCRPLLLLVHSVYSLCNLVSKAQFVQVARRHTYNPFRLAIATLKLSGRLQLWLMLDFINSFNLQKLTIIFSEELSRVSSSFLWCLGLSFPETVFGGPSYFSMEASYAVFSRRHTGILTEVGSVQRTLLTDCWSLFQGWCPFFSSQFLKVE